MLVAVNLAEVSRYDLGLDGTTWGNQGNRGGRYGQFLRVADYVRNQTILPPPEKLYCAGRSACDWVKPTLQLSEIAFLLGLYLGDGWLDNTRKVRGRIGFALAADQEATFHKEVAKIKSIQGHCALRKRKEKNIEITFNNLPLGELLFSIMGPVTAQTKFIPAAWIYTWPRQARRQLLEGLICSGGHVSKKNIRRHAFTTSSYQLAHDLYVLLTSLRLLPSLVERKVAPGGVVDGRQIKGGRSWSVDWSDITASILEVIAFIRIVRSRYPGSGIAWPATGTHAPSGECQENIDGTRYI